MRKTMKLATMFLLLSGALAATHAITPLDKWGRLQAKAGKLYDATGMGGTRIRGALYMCAIVAKTYNPQCKAMWDRLTGC